MEVLKRTKKCNLLLIGIVILFIISCPKKAFATNNNEVTNLADIPYDTIESKTEWDSITIDKTTVDKLENVEENNEEEKLEENNETENLEEEFTVKYIRTIESYDTEIKEKYLENEEQITDELELLILQREFVYQAGVDSLKTFIEENPEENSKMLDWLMENQELLKLFLVGGKPKGTYTDSLKILYRMYNTYKEDWETEEVNEYGIKLKNVYRTMMIASSLEHSGKVYFWIDGKVYSTPETRYEIYKNLYTNNLIESRIFEKLTVEEMRWVINTIIDDNEIEWLNNYTRTVKNGATGPYSYITYKFGYNYNKPEYYDLENYDIWNEKYGLSEYNVEYQTGKPKLWIVFEEGAVCGGLSKTGSCVWGSFKGLPNTCVCQPSHCAYAMYSKNENGQGVWNLGNNVGGWGPCGNTEQLNSRMMNDWKATEGGWAGSYILLAQAAQNEYKTYEEAQIQMMLARVYNSENLYRKVLETENINFGAWESLINLYSLDSNKTDADYIELEKEIVDALMYYPKPMVDLLTKIERKISSPVYTATFNNVKTTALQTALENAKNSIQETAVKEVATYLLGQYDSKIATFSFDGENSNSIVIGEKYKDSEIAWEYSLDGGETWNLSQEHIQKLTIEEINSITEENDIKIHIMGVDYSDANIYTIDITKSNIPTGLYNNDLENQIIGNTDKMLWRFSEKDPWISFSNKTPDLTGDKTVYLKVGASGTMLPSDVWTAEFTEDNQPNNRKYISINNLSISSVSSEATANNGFKEHAIDGNFNTLWHSSYNGSDTERYIVIELAEPKKISALEYVPRQSGANGRIKDYELSLSIDGNEWVEAGTGTWENSATTKTIELEESIEAKFVKLQAKTNYGDGRSFISALMINLFEDIEKTEVIVEKYELDGDYITQVMEKTSVSDFKKNIKTNEQITIVDKYENVVPENSIIATGMNLKVGKNKEYTIIVKGDIDEDGRVTVNDLAKLKLHLIERIELIDINLKGANMDNNSRVTLNDLAQMKLFIIN